MPTTDRSANDFADGSPKPAAATPHLLYRFGRRIGDQDVVRHARALRGEQPAADLLPGANGSIARPLSAMFDASWRDEPPREFPMPAQAWLAATGVLTARSRAGTAAGLFLAAKAGHNAESHNHNDIGSFIVALDGRPLLIDVGVGVYTRQTFGPQRYEIWTMQSSWHNVPEVGGIQQAAGPEHAARRVQGLLGPGAAELSMDLAGAYPAEAGIRSWRRTIRLDRGGTGDGTIVLEDAWEINQSPERIVVHLIAAREPCPVAPGRLAIAGDDSSLIIAYPHADFDAGLEERPLDDPRLAATWGPRIFRIVLAAKHPARQGTAHLEITKAPVSR